MDEKNLSIIGDIYGTLYIAEVGIDGTHHTVFSGIAFV